MRGQTYCEYCSHSKVATYHNGLCPRIKSIEHYPSGKAKRVEFYEYEQRDKPDNQEEN